MMDTRQTELLDAVRDLQRAQAAYRAARDRVDAAMAAAAKDGAEPRTLADIERSAIEEG